MKMYHRYVKSLHVGFYVGTVLYLGHCSLGCSGFHVRCILTESSSSSGINANHDSLRATRLCQIHCHGGGCCAYINSSRFGISTQTVLLLLVYVVIIMVDEHLDAAGNPVSVGNLTFLEGILGKGAYGTVRLAKRISSNVGEESVSMHSSLSSFGSHNRNNKIARTKSQNEHRNDGTTTGASGCSNDNGNISSSLSSHPPASTRILSRRAGAEHTRSRSAPQGKDPFGIFTTSTICSNSNSSSTSTPILQKAIHKLQRHRSEEGFFSKDDTEQQLQTQTEQLVAVKIFQKSVLKRMRTMERNKDTKRMQVKTALEKVEREIALMKKLAHPNLVGFYEVIDSPESDMLYMVIEYMPLGEILTYMNNGTFRRRGPRNKQEVVQGLVDGHFNEYQAALYFVDILHGLAYLHEHHIIHRDLKPENILLDARGRIAKLSDFGVSHIFDDEIMPEVEEEQQIQHSYHQHTHSSSSSSDPLIRHFSSGLTRHDTDTALSMKGMPQHGLMTKTEGTWAFWSPEMCDGSGKAFSGYAADLWAAGVCLYIFVTGKLPFYDEAPAILMEQIRKANVPYEGLGLSNELVDLLKMALHKDPEQRAGVGDCLKHPFLVSPRAQRVQELSVELARSMATNTIVEESDIRAVRHLSSFYTISHSCFRFLY